MLGRNLPLNHILRCQTVPGDKKIISALPQCVARAGCQFGSAASRPGFPTGSPGWMPVAPTEPTLMDQQVDDP